MQTQRPSLVISDVSAMAGPRLLFENFSYELQATQALILRGKNGIGKTTLLEIIAGLSKAHTGQITLSESAKPSINTHYLGHQNGLKSAHSVRQNLGFFAVFDGAETSSIEAAISAMELAGLLDLPISVLSQGQKRRVAFARLLLSPRLIWILDEPTAALDENVSGLIEQSCIAHLENGGIIIAATHLPFLEAYKNAQTLDLATYT